jgi:hypothetical protein
MLHTELQMCEIHTPATFALSYDAAINYATTPNGVDAFGTHTTLLHANGQGDCEPMGWSPGLGFEQSQTACA